LNWSAIHSVARRPSLNWMATSNINSDAAIQASFAGRAKMRQLRADPPQDLNPGLLSAFLRTIKIASLEPKSAAAHARSP
jgi:hypothetical protein